jgi:hypothetical protein
MTNTGNQDKDRVERVVSDSPAAGRDPQPDRQSHWFTGRSLDVLLYRVNRRSETLFEPPPDILEHLELVLERPRTIESGRRHKRQWRVGNKVFDRGAGTLTGMIGWARSVQALNTTWDEENESWIDVVVPGDVSAVSPFVFVVQGRYLGVLKHASFGERTIAQVFTDLLNHGERERPSPTTEWDVEPVGDLQEFYEWVSSTDRITSVRFVFKRPNPDAEDQFRQLFERLDAHEARQITEQIVARNPERGLNKNALRTEPTTNAFISAAMAAYGYIVGRGFTRNRDNTWDQRRRAARERLEDVAPTWDGATDQVRRAVRRFRERRDSG